MLLRYRRHIRSLLLFYLDLYPLLYLLLSKGGACWIWLVLVLYALCSNEHVIDTDTSHVCVTFAGPCAPC